jgi:hypothetical protein
MKEALVLIEQGIKIIGHHDVKSCVKCNQTNKVVTDLVANYF